MMWVGLLFLPEKTNFNLPLLPDIGKYELTALCCGIAQLVMAKREYRDARLMRSREWILLLALPLAKVITTFTNMDIPPGVKGAMSPMDIPAVVIGNLLGMTVPFLLGRMVFRTSADAILLLRVVVTCAVLYLPFEFVEMSQGPVFHLWVYGFMQHLLEQSVKGTGFRPMVFTASGLALAVTKYMAAAGAVILARTSKSRVLGLPAWAAATLLVVLFPFFRSVGALVYVVLTLAALLWLRPKEQTKLAFGIAIAIWTYMVARIFNLINVWPIIGQLAKLSAERAQSLGFRLYAEEILVARAMERPIWGWGGWGRNLPPGAIADGMWIIELGMWGIVGLFVAFGMLTFPIYLTWRRVARAAPEAQALMSGISLILAFSVADLLPNGLFNYQQIFFAGALAGLAWGIPESSKSSLLPLLATWYSFRRRRGREFEGRLRGEADGASPLT